MIKKLIMALTVLGLLFIASMALAEQKSITLPVGTTVKMEGEKAFALTLPDGNTVEIKNFDAKVNIMQGAHKILVGEEAKRGVTGNCKIYDKSGKPILIGTKPVIMNGSEPPKGSKLSANEFIKIGEATIYLPAKLIFMSEETKGATEHKSEPIPVKTK